MNNTNASQSFLRDVTLINKLLDLTSINKNDVVLEIGSGDGSITFELSKRCAKLIALEDNDSKYNALSEKDSEIEFQNISFFDYSFKDSNLKVIANMPFSVTSDLFNKILLSNSFISELYIIMQKDTATMYLGKEKNTMKSIFIKSLYDSEIIYEFDKYDFEPPQSSETVFVKFIKKEKCDIGGCKIEDFFDFISYLFINKNKTLQSKVLDVLTYEQYKRVKNQLKSGPNSTITSSDYNDFITLFDVYKDFSSETVKRKVIGSYNNYRIPKQKQRKRS